MPTQKLIFYFIFSAYYFLKLHSQNSRNQGFSYYFCMMIEGSRSGSGSIPLTNGSGSGSRRPKNMWNRWIRIQEAQKHVDPVDPDPDPQHCLKMCFSDIGSATNTFADRQTNDLTWTRGLRWSSRTETMSWSPSMIVRSIRMLRVEDVISRFGVLKNKDDPEL
jgi:hypothetical protein